MFTFTHPGQVPSGARLHLSQELINSRIANLKPKKKLQNNKNET